MMLAWLAGKSRWVIRGRGHGCTDIGVVAARTYGWKAFPLLLGLAKKCWLEDFPP